MVNLDHLKDLPSVDSISEEYQIKDTRIKYGLIHKKRRTYSNIFTLIEVILVVLLFIFLIMLVTIDSDTTLYTVSVALTITCGALMIIGFIIFSIYLSISKKPLQEEEDALDNWEKLVREHLQINQEEIETDNQEDEQKK